MGKGVWAFARYPVTHIFLSGAAGQGTLASEAGLAWHGRG